MIITNEVRVEYLNKHLPYRINSMLAHDLIMRRKTDNHFAAIRDRCYGDSTVVEPIFEISLIFGRCLLNFLGISLDSKKRISQFRAKPDDLTIQTLFPGRNFCPIDDDIILESYDPLCTIIRLANKSVAHLTSTVDQTHPNEHDVLPQARIAIYKLMLKYVPEINKENIWWWKQVEGN